MKAVPLCLLLWSFALCAVSAPLKGPPAPPNDPGWPREITRSGIKLSIYQPQIDEWKDHRDLKARAAFVMTTKDGKPVVGVAELAGQTTANIQERTILIRDLKITAAHFPSLPEAEVGPTEALLKQTFPGRSLTISLDRLAAGAEKTKLEKPLELKMDPPKIFVSLQSAILLMVQGKPVQAPIAGKKLQFVVNTNWDLFFDPESAAFYVLADQAWLTAAKLDGEWALATKLPSDFAKLPKGDQWDHVKKQVPAKVERGMTIPYVFYSEQPAELVEFKGNPIWQEVEATSLLWAKNTESWVFENTEDRQIYFLVSGRWFRSAKWEGPWTYAGNDLPDDFKKIPLDSECADVLASVPGTEEAADAVLLAQVPQEAIVKRKEVEAKAKVTYDGQPEFKPIQGEMSYATNTSSDVIQVGNKYYLCQDAVWFVSSAPLGPWVLCVDVPAIIYAIPPEYPVHRVVYVTTVVGETDDLAVCSYTAGYFGAFIAEAATTAALVWGTGWYYEPFVAWGGPVPIFRPWPATYGFAAAYNPWSGGYAMGGAIYGPYAAAGRAAWYNPVTGNYGRAARVAGPYGARTVAADYNPRTDTAWATRQGNNGYAQWGTSAVRRGDDWVRAGHVATDDGGIAHWHGSDGGGRVWKTDDHSGGFARHDGNFYAGHDGNVYRRDDNGNWSKYNDGDWNSIDHKDAANRFQQNRSEARDNLANRNVQRPENFDRPDRTDRPNQPERPDFSNRPGQDGGGVRKFDPSNFKRPGQDGGGQRFDRDEFANRAASRRADAQPSEDVMNRLSRRSADRQRSDFHMQQNHEFQRPTGQSFNRAPSHSPSFSCAGRGGMRRR